MSLHSMRRAALAVAALLIPWHALAEPLKVGIWSSGIQLGLAALLEEKQFFKEQGIEVELVKFTDVNGPTKALLTKSVDAAISAAAAGTLNLAADGVPVRIVLSTQISDGKLVVPERSAITSIADLKGRKIGMSAPGSAGHAITTAILERNYGLKPTDYTAIGANDARLAQLLAQGEIDAALLRGVTILQIKEPGLRALFDTEAEWGKVAGSANSLPILGVGAVHDDALRAQPETVARFLAAVRRAVQYGGEHPADVRDVLQRAVGLSAQDADGFAKLWKNLYLVRFEPEDVASLKTTAAVYRAGGTLKADVPESTYVTAPYLRSKELVK